KAPIIWEALTEGYRRMYRIFDALTCVNRWLDQQPDTAQALILRGDVNRQANALQKALPDYQRAVELDPARDDARWGLAISLMETGRFDEAATQLETLQPRRPDDPELVVRLARCHG